MNTIRKIVFACLSFATITHLSAQVEQKGIVFEYQGEQPKTPLSAVSIAAKDAGNVMSEGDGTFTLQFRTLHPGSDIQMRRIEKSGYEVMNQEIIEQFRVGGKDSRPIQVVMCSKVRLQQLRDSYRSVASKRYEQQLKLSEAEAEKLRQEGKLKEEEFNARLDALEEEYEDKLTKLENYIDKFARIDLSEVDTYEQQIVGLVQEGKFDEAIALYDQQDFPGKIKQSREARQKLVEMKTTIAQAELAQAEENQRLRQSIDRQITLLRMAGGEENLKKVHELYHQVYLADTTHVQSRIEYANSLLRYGLLDDAIQIIKAGIASETNELHLGRMWNNLFLLYYQQGNLNQAMGCVRKADSLLTLVQDTSSVTRSRYMPVVYSNYLLDYMTFSGSAEIAQRCHQYWEPDTMSDESVVRYSFLVSLLSEYYHHVGNHEMSVWCARQGLVLGEIMERKWPWKSDYMQNCATACSTFAYEGMKAEALKNASLYIQLLRPLLKSRSSLNVVLLNAGYNSCIVLEALTLLEEPALADSLMAIMDEWKVLPTVEEKSPGIMDEVIGRYDLNRSTLLLGQGKIAEAEQLAQQSLDKIAQNDNGALYIGYMRPGTMAKIRQVQGRYPEAESLYQEAIAQARKVFETDPQDYDTGGFLCRYYVGWAQTCQQQGKTKEFKKILKQAAQYAEYGYDRQLINNNKK